jgi:acyl dehydratase
VQVQTFTLEELATAAGTRLGPSDWLVVDQARIDAFAETTGDHQWIHVDPERAQAGPFGGTIAHGLLTLSLLPVFRQQLFDVTGARLAINYGFNRVRFPAPVPAGSRLRALAEIADVSDLGEAVQCVTTFTMEVESGNKPACVADAVARYVR